MIVLIFFCTKKRWYVTFYFHILPFSLPLQFQSQMRHKNLGTVLFLHFLVVTLKGFLKALNVLTKTFFELQQTSVKIKICMKFILVKGLGKFVLRRVTFL